MKKIEDDEYLRQITRARALWKLSLKKSKNGEPTLAIKKMYYGKVDGRPPKCSDPLMFCK